MLDGQILETIAIKQNECLEIKLILNRFLLFD